jgi:hypothetical protein
VRRKQCGRIFVLLCATDLPIVKIWTIQTIENPGTCVLSMPLPGSIPTRGLHIAYKSSLL